MRTETKRNKIYRRYVYMKVDKYQLTTDKYRLIYFALHRIRDIIIVTIKYKIYNLVS